ncbi:MAG: 5-formyltetrahydrofolate cyclo-ligase [Deltaproteobacteria bacterium]|nr:MAG: 5-formyltetrahydrofolate cyclo-ligase [Deltaproteobacteria bacterium]
MDLPERKRALRREFIALRRAVDVESARRAALRVSERVVATPEFRTAPRVALYAACGGELDTRPIFDAAAGKLRLFPRARSGSALCFVPVETWTELVPGELGVLEPPPGSTAVALDPRDLVLVPGVAFDRAGHRLGRGGGYYDRTFVPAGAGQPALFGLAFDFQLVDALPSGPHDRGVDAVVTEAALVRIRGSAGEESPSGSVA